MTGKKETIGFIGTGVMGASMAHRLLAAGYTLRVYNRTRAKAATLLEQGAQWCDRAAEAAEGADVVISIVGFPEDVRTLYLGETGVLAQAGAGQLLIDMTTSDPQLAVEIAQQATAKGCAALDAPVSGGDIGAREGRLSIMVGGSENAFERALPILRQMGENIVRQGEAGCGQHCKMANQIAIASNMLGVCEAIAYAEQAGLAPQTVLESISSGAAGSWSLTNLAPRMLADDYSPGFFIRHFVKDLSIALASAEALQLSLPGLKLAHQCYAQLEAMGEGGRGTQALMKFYRDASAGV